MNRGTVVLTRLGICILASQYATGGEGQYLDKTLMAVLNWGQPPLKRCKSHAGSRLPQSSVYAIPRQLR
jgi:hypothetical protein